MAKMTPMMQQYLDIKSQYGDAILFYRMGDFYEMFHDDAVVASRILGITLTSRDKNKENPVPMCGIPYHSATGYIARLIKAGRKVAVCEQTADPSTVKGLVPREVVQVVTPGLIVEENHLDNDQANYLMAVCRSKKLFGLAFIDISTGDFRVTEVASRQDMLSELGRVSPSEVLVSEEGLVQDGYFVSRLDYEPSLQRCSEMLSLHFNTIGIDGLGLKDHPAALVAAGMVLNYVRETQKAVLKHINRLRYYNPGNFMILGANTKRNLEIFESISGGVEGTLYHVLNHTVSAMGARRLADWISFPLMDPLVINARLDAIEELVAAGLRITDLRTILKGVPDLERIIGRVAAGRATPRDIVALADGLERIPLLAAELGTLQSPLVRQIADGLDPLAEVVSRIRATVVEDPPIKLTDGNVIALGVSAELDELKSLRRDSRQWIAELEASEKRKTGINTLKIGYNRVFGYYLEVTKANAAAVPESYIRKQTLANAERYITPELKEYEAKLLGAQDAIAKIELDIFGELRDYLVEQILRMQATASTVADLDAIVCLGYIAVQNGFKRPNVTAERGIDIRDGRHPVVEKVLRDGEFVPNNCHFDGPKDTLHIITGPNMAGKSTFMRQVALITIMAQMGSFVPARQAEIGVVDRIFTRIGALDNLSAGQSTFLVEMSETADILNNATSLSLVILDEIGRGTSTYDGMSLAWAVAEYLDQKRVRTFFATHYHELADLARRHKGIKNYHMAIEESGHEVIFLRELKRGAIGKSYGIHVAKLAGVPEDVVTNARFVLENIGRKGKSVPKSQADVAVQASLFDAPAAKADDGLADEIRALDLEQLKPIEALNILYALKEKVSDS